MLWRLETSQIGIVWRAYRTDRWSLTWRLVLIGSIHACAARSTEEHIRSSVLRSIRSWLDQRMLWWTNNIAVSIIIIIVR